jgi:hypothetical protein
MDRSTDPRGNSPARWQDEVIRPAAWDWPVIAALFIAFVGWFLVDVVSVSAGSLHQGFRFYELPALIGQPSRIVTIGHPQASSIAFGLLCFAMLSALLTSEVGSPAWRRRIPLVSFVAPLALMLLCAALLWYRASRDTVAVAEGATEFQQAFANLANVLAAHASTVVVRHLRVGYGAWLSILSTLYLAYHGLRPWIRRPAPR